MVSGPDKNHGPGKQKGREGRGGRRPGARGPVPDSDWQTKQEGRRSRGESSPEPLPRERPANAGRLPTPLPQCPARPGGPLGPAGDGAARGGCRTRHESPPPALPRVRGRGVEAAWAHPHGRLGERRESAQRGRRGAQGPPTPPTPAGARPGSPPCAASPRPAPEAPGEGAGARGRGRGRDRDAPPSPPPPRPWLHSPPMPRPPGRPLPWPTDPNPPPCALGRLPPRGPATAASPRAHTHARIHARARCG